MLNRSILRAAVASIPLLAAVPAMAQVIPGRAAQREPQTGDEAVAATVAVVGDAKGDAKGGATVRIAVTLDIVPGWHVYWENPGESGAPTEIALELPAGCTAVQRADGKPAIAFPVPTVFTHGETVFGYEKTVTLSVAVKLPESLPAGGLPVKVRTSWLVCKQSCLQGRSEATVDLAKPVAADSKAAKALADSLARLPKPLPAEWKVAIKGVEADKAVLEIAGPASAAADGELRFIPNDTPGVLLASGYLADAKGRVISVPLALSRESALGKPLEAAGLLVVGKNGPAYSFRVAVPAP